jgi:hypothetical protein
VRTVWQASRVQGSVGETTTWWYQTGAQGRANFFAGLIFIIEIRGEPGRVDQQLGLPRPTRFFLTSPLSTNYRFAAMTPDVRSAVAADTRAGKREPILNTFPYLINAQM